MAPYESDSSFDEDDVYNETNVLLGYAAQKSTDDNISQLGGFPAWLDGKTAPSGELAKCKVCNSLLTLLLQLHGDLPSRFPSHERRLYILGCRRKACRRKEGSIRGVRAGRVTEPIKVEEKELKQNQQSTDIGTALFSPQPSAPHTANPFSISSNSGNSSTFNPFASASSLAAKPPQKPTEPPVAGLSESFAAKVRISSADLTPPTSNTPCLHQPWPPQSSFPPPYPKYFLDAEYEALDTPSAASEPPSTLDTLKDTEMDDAGASGSIGKEEEKQLFESSMDKTFQRFADRLAQNPEQVLRYEFGGQPLLYSSTDAIGKMLDPHYYSGNSGSKVTSGKEETTASGMPRCQNCGAERVFELQLVPYAITVLEENEDVGLDGMDWGTVILGVCSKDCMPRDTREGEIGYLEEWVGVQWEELAPKSLG